MKTHKLIFVFILFSGLIYAQSDYQTLQEFKSQLKQFEKQVEEADSNNTLDSLYASLAKFENEYKNEKKLLDESLYPETYTSSINKIRQSIRAKKKDLLQRDVLQVKVTKLEGELESLNKKNSNLLAELKDYQSIGGSPEEVRNLVSQLRNSLEKRDNLVKSMVDSLLSEFVNHPMTLSDAEAEKIQQKIESGKLFYNVEKTIRDNIEFLKVTDLAPADLEELKSNQSQFFRLWKKLGPRIADTYSGSKNKASDVEYINGLFVEWGERIDRDIWDKINSVFTQNNVQIDSFYSTETFIENFTSYIDSQIVEVEQIGYDESYKVYSKFKKDVWKNELVSDWLPLLRYNQMLSSEQFEALQDKMDQWEDAYDVKPTQWWYYAIPIVAIILILLVVFRNKITKEPNESKNEKSL